MPNRTGDKTRIILNLDDLISLSEAAKVSGLSQGHKHRRKAVVSIKGCNEALAT
jgi:hypothetical protein